MLRLLTFASCLLAGPALAADLTIVISGVLPDEGSVYAVLYSDAASWENETHDEAVSSEVDASGSVRLTFVGRPAGTYTVFAFQDRVSLGDNNTPGALDRNPAFFNKPTEPYGMPNGARGSIAGAPKFDDISFVVADVDIEVGVALE